MARKKTKSKNKGGFLWFGKKKKKKSRGSKPAESSKTTFLKVAALLGVILVVAGLGWGFRILEQYVFNTVRLDQSKDAYLVLVDKPQWVNHAIETAILKCARQSSENLAIDENAAPLIADNLKRNMAWMDTDSILVKTHHDSIEIHAEYRKPVATFFLGKTQYYVDENLWVLDYVPMPESNIIEIRGFDRAVKPLKGSVWRQDDIDAAVKLIKMLQLMDKARQLQKPLLSEIDYLNVSNYGSRNAKVSQLILVAKDGTKVLWGAPPGKSQIYLEADETEKLKKLYGFYEQYGTIQDRVRLIDPRIPERKIPTPGH